MALSEAEELELLELEEQEYQESQKPATPTAPELSKTKSAVRGAAQGVTMGFADETLGAIGVPVQKVMDAVTGNKENENVGIKELYQRLRDEERAKDVQARTANPKTYMGGEFVGGMATAAVPGTQADTAARLAALGGIQGFGNSEADMTEGDFKGAARDTGIGAGLGLGLGKGLPAAADKLGIGKASKWLAEKAANIPEALEDFAQTRGASALGFTKRLINTPEKLAKAKNTAGTMLDEGVITPFASAETMAERAGALREKAGTEIGKFLKQQGNGFSTKSAVDAINDLRPVNAQGLVLTGGEYDAMNKIIDDAIGTVKAHGDTMSFEEANELKGLFQKLVNWNTSKNETGLRGGVAGKMRGTVDDQLEQMAFSKTPGVANAVKKSGAPIATPEYEGFLKNKKVYGAASHAEDYALPNRMSSEQGNQLLSPQEVLLGGMEAATGSPPIKTGLTMAAFRGAKRYGNQIMATGARGASKATSWLGDKIPDIVKSNPQVLGKYAPIFQNAMLRGAEQVGLSHWLLMNSDPEYNAMLHDLEDGKENNEF